MVTSRIGGKGHLRQWGEMAALWLGRGTAPAYAAFNPTSVNTLRIWVLNQEHGPAVRLAYLRIGREGSLVDNHAAGGIVAPVDLESGRLAAAHDGNPTQAIFSVHPDHGAAIESVVLPRFDEAAALARKCLRALPRLNFAGVDVAMTSGGPVIVESNSQPSREGAAYVGLPTRDVLGT